MTATFRPVRLLISVLAACSSGGGQPGPVAAVGSAYVDGTYHAELRYFRDVCTMRSVTATGPGASAPVALQCDALSREWWASVPIGATYQPPPFVYTYTFTIDDGQRTHEETAAIPCWLTQLPTTMAPDGSASVASPITFRWTMLAASGLEYTVYVFGPQSTTWTVVDQASMTVPLAPGTYKWFVDVIAIGGHDPGSAKYCSARASGANFTVTP